MARRICDSGAESHITGTEGERSGPRQEDPERSALEEGLHTEAWDRGRYDFEFLATTPLVTLYDFMCATPILRTYMI